MKKIKKRLLPESESDVREDISGMEIVCREKNIPSNMIQHSVLQKTISEPMMKVRVKKMIPFMVKTCFFFNLYDDYADSNDKSLILIYFRGLFWYIGTFLFVFPKIIVFFPFFFADKCVFCVLIYNSQIFSLLTVSEFIPQPTTLSIKRLKVTENEGLRVAGVAEPV